MRSFPTGQTITLRNAAVAALALAGGIALVFAEGPRIPWLCPHLYEACNLAEPAGLSGSLGHGRGAAFVDIDSDGWDDVFDGDTAHADGGGAAQVFLNQKNGTFRSVPLGDIGISLRDPCAAWGAAFADYDNDGDTDALFANGGYCTEPSSLVLFENRLAETGKLFFSKSNASGITGERHLWWGASWADYDRDGWLDFAAVDRAGRVWLYRGQGNGTFREVADELGVTISFQDGKNPVWIDYDLDGYPDLYLAGMDRHALYHNDGGVRFHHAAEPAMGFETLGHDSNLIGFPWPYVDNRPGTALPFVFAAVSADFNQDGWPDLYLGREFLQDFVLVNQKDGTFKGYGREAGLDMKVEPDRSENTMGLGVGDVNDDGYPDIFLGAGSPRQEWMPIAYCNTGTFPLMFTRCYRSITVGVGKTQTHGIALGDPDRDGDTDMFFNLGGAHPTRGRPDIRDSHAHNAYIVRDPRQRPKTAAIKLVGAKSNRDAIGARVSVGGSPAHHYTVLSAQGFQSQNSAWLSLALDETGAAPITITWPSGLVSWATAQNGERLVIAEPTGAAGTAP